MPMAAKPDRTSAIAVSATPGSALRLSLRASRAKSRDAAGDSATATWDSRLAAAFRAADFEERVPRVRARAPESRIATPESRVERYHAPTPADTLHATATS